MKRIITISQLTLNPNLCFRNGGGSGRQEEDDEPGPLKKEDPGPEAVMEVLYVLPEQTSQVKEPQKKEFVSIGIPIYIGDIEGL